MTEEHNAKAAATTTRAVVDALFSAIREGDTERALAFVAETVDWGGAGDPAIPWIGKRHTRLEVAEFFDLLRENFRTNRFEIEHEIVDGEHAALIADVDQVLIKTGQPFAGKMAFHLQVVGGKVVRYNFFEDSLALASAWKWQ